MARGKPWDTTHNYCPICGVRFSEWSHHRCSERACRSINAAHARERDGIMDEAIHGKTLSERLKDGFRWMDDV